MLFEHTTLAASASALVSALRLYGCNAEAIFRQVGLDIDAILRPGARYRVQDIVQLWQAVREETDDPAVGIAIGQHMRPSALHSLGLSWISSPTVLEGLRRVQRYARVTNTLLRVDVTEHSDQAKFELGQYDSQLVLIPEYVDAAFSVVIEMCRTMTDAHFAPASVAFKHPDNGRIDRHIEFFKCPVHYSAGENSMYFDLPEIAQPAPAGNREIAYANDRITEQYLASLDPDLLQDKAREYVVSLLPSGRVSQEVVIAAGFPAAL
ncbi:MAG TPA: AraC family transcriptional regulator [Gammaproteobacteria bacterium]|nr:AraC family transcriptional regulator [Gammaproteobacteria bacterium]